MADEDFRKALGESFIEIADTDEGREIISVFSQVGYTWGQDSDYDGERAAQELLKSLEGLSSPFKKHLPRGFSGAAGLKGYLCCWKSNMSVKNFKTAPSP